MGCLFLCTKKGLDVSIQSKIISYIVTNKNLAIKSNAMIVTTISFFLYFPDNNVINT